MLITKASESIAPAVVKSIMKEVKELTQNPPEGIKVISNDEDVTDVQAIIEGPGLKIVLLTYINSWNTF